MRQVTSGIEDAADADSTIKKVIEEFHITDREQQRRLVARRSG